MAKLRGRDVLKAAEIRDQLEDLNKAFDGPGEVAIVAPVRACDSTGAATSYEPPRVAHMSSVESVVMLPGDGKPFPVRAYVEALLCSEVQFEP